MPKSDTVVSDIVENWYRIKKVTANPIYDIRLEKRCRMSQNNRVSACDVRAVKMCKLPKSVVTQGKPQVAHEAQVTPKEAPSLYRIGNVRAMRLPNDESATPNPPGDDYRTYR